MTQTTPKDVAARRQAAELAAHADQLSGRLLDVTTCLYTSDADGNAEAAGSAVFLAIGSARFLLSAAHVLEERKQQNLYVPTRDGLAPLAGDFTTVYSKTAATLENDHVDLAIARLGSALAEQIPAEHFVQWEEIDHTRLTHAGHALALLGYPLTKQRSPIEGQYIVARAYRLAAIECPAPVYAAEGHDPKVSVLLGVDRKRTWSPEGQVTAPDLYGISGGGIWCFGRRLREATLPPRLAGIAIEWIRRRRHKYVLATRIEVAIAALVQQYDDIGQTVKNLLV